MLKRAASTAIATIMLFGCGEAPTETSSADTAPAPTVLTSGIDKSSWNTDVRAQDDFFRHINETWINNTEIPADLTSFGVFRSLRDKSEAAQKTIIEEAAGTAGHAAGSDKQRIGDFYNAFMDVDAVETAGMDPIAEELAGVAAATSHDDIARLFGRFERISIGNPFGSYVDADFGRSTHYITYIGQGGLGMPDRDYYLENDERNTDIRAKYVVYLEQLFTAAGLDNAGARAANLLAMETELAEIQWSRVESRDRNKTYNKRSLEAVATDIPDMKWDAYIEASGFDEAPELVIRQLSYVEKFGPLFAATSVDTWKDYLVARLVDNSAPYLTQALYDNYFEFRGRTLSGQQEARPRWKRAVEAVSGAMGELIGKVYVKEHFPPEAKERMVTLVTNLEKALSARIAASDWMGEATKTEAQAKLANFHKQIGYPDRWEDFSALTITPGGIVSNVWQARAFNHDKWLGRAGTEVDHDLWGWPPQTVNAGYSASENLISFPAGILQAPFFNLAADDAANYGAIGVVIGHEIGHGFDDQGRKTDGKGELRDWWTEEDTAAYKTRTDKLVAQFDAFCPFEDACVNGSLTLGENVGDLTGVAVAYEAYKMSLDGEEAPVIDGLTGDERFFMGYGQIWQSKSREARARQLLTIDPHSPGEYRVNGILRNFTPFYDVFDVKEGDGMYLPLEERVAIW